MMTYRRAAAKPAEKIGALAFVNRLLLKRQLRASWRYPELMTSLDDPERNSPAGLQGRPVRPIGRRDK